jgi:hypothetical protein
VNTRLVIAVSCLFCILYLYIFNVTLIFPKAMALDIVKFLGYFFPVAQQPNSGLGRLIIEVYTSHTIRKTHRVGLLWMRNQLVVEAATYTTHNKIRTHDPRIEAASDLRLRQHGHRYRPRWVINWHVFRWNLCEVMNELYCSFLDGMRKCKIFRQDVLYPDVSPNYSIEN